MPNTTPPPGLRSLRYTLFAALAFVLVLLIAAQFLVTSRLTERQLLEIESADAYARLRKLHHALGVLEEDLDRLAGDWAQWEGVHKYASGKYPQFVEFNIIPVTFTGLRLDFIAIVDAQGNLAYAQHLDADGKSLLDAPNDVRALLEPNGALRQFERRTNGLIATSRGPLLVSVQPVLSYAGEPLPNARFVMGRSLEQFATPALARITGETLAAHRADGAADEGLRRNEFGDGLRLKDGEIEGVTELADLWGRPAAHLHLYATRPTQALVSAAHQRLLIAAFIIGALFCSVMVLIGRSKVIAPLERLAAAVDRLRDRPESAARVPIESSAREFATLSAAINAMLEQHEQQQVMRRDRDAAVEANRLKSEFLATMSHEIRTPMNGVLGMCELLQRTELNPRQRRLSDTIVRSARSLLEILNDILDFSKIESGKLELEQAEFSPSELVQSACAPYVATAHSKGLALAVHIAPDVPQDLIGDALRLRQVLGNLLSNAFKFTAHGSVTVSCAVERAEAEAVYVRFTVTDTGIGVSPEVQQRIFEPFTQADSNTSRCYGGTGLGLAIVRRLITLMNGEVRLRSVPGQGAEFSIIAPLKRAIVPITPRETPDATGARFTPANAPAVLLAEDNAVNREVLTEMLEYFGCRVTAVDDGAQALAKAAEARFDVVLMDCHMPVMDGVTAAAEWRALERAEARTPTFIVALTADATVENRLRCIEAGMNEVIAKPISQGRLRSLIFRVCAESGDLATVSI